MRVLVCGDRNWTDTALLHRELNALHRQNEITLLIQGEAKGADKLAALWAAKQGVQVLSFPANWEKFGRAAGPVRNRQMLLEGQPDLVVAFHADIQQSKGTKNMLQLAKKAGLARRLLPAGQELP